MFEIIKFMLKFEVLHIFWFLEDRSLALENILVWVGQSRRCKELDY